MRATPKLRAYLRRFRKVARPPRPPVPDNPYRRYFTPHRSLEELAPRPPARK